MRDWFDSLALRERLLVLSGVAVVIAGVLFALVWRPLDSGQTSLAASVATWERSLAELRPLRGLMPAGAQSRSSSRNDPQQTPVVIVDQTLRARGLDRALKRSQPTTGNGIRVEFEDVAFDDLVLWLGDLSGQHAMHVQSGSLSVASRAGPGRINATLTLERAL